MLLTKRLKAKSLPQFGFKDGKLDDIVLQKSAWYDGRYVIDQKVEGDDLKGFTDGYQFSAT